MPSQRFGQVSAFFLEDNTGDVGRVTGCRLEVIDTFLDARHFFAHVIVIIACNDEYDISRVIIRTTNYPVLRIALGLRVFDRVTKDARLGSLGQPIGESLVLQRRGEIGIFDQLLDAGKREGDVNPGGLDSIGFDTTARPNGFEQANEGEHFRRRRDEWNLSLEPTLELLFALDFKYENSLKVLVESADNIALNVVDIKHRFIAGIGESGID